MSPDTGEHTPTRQASTLFTYPRGIEVWVVLGDLLRTKMVYLPPGGRTIQVQMGPVSINYVDESHRATLPPLIDMLVNCLYGKRN